LSTDAARSVPKSIFLAGVELEAADDVTADFIVVFDDVTTVIGSTINGFSCNTPTGDPDEASGHNFVSETLIGFKSVSSGFNGEAFWLMMLAEFLPVFLPGEGSTSIGFKSISSGFNGEAFLLTLLAEFLPVFLPGEGSIPPFNKLCTAVLLAAALRLNRFFLTEPVFRTGAAFFLGVPDLRRDARGGV